MRRIINRCVDCGLPCIGSSCLYRNVQIYYCDSCPDKNAEYQINSEDLCEDCLKDYLKDIFNDLTIEEQAKLLGVDLKKF